MGCRQRTDLRIKAYEQCMEDSKVEDEGEALDQVKGVGK